MSEEAATVEGTGAESTGIDAGVAELTQDFFGDSEPSESGGIAAAEEADAGAGEQSGEQGDQSQVEEQQTAPRQERQPRKAKSTEPEQAQEAVYTVRGRKLTAAQIAADPELLADLATTHEQHRYLQDKYLKTLEEVKQTKLSPQAAPQQQQYGPNTVTPDQITQAFGPEAAAMAAAGYLDPHFVDAYPNVAANVVGYRKVIEGHDAALRQLQGQVNQFVQGTQQARQQQEVHQIVSGFDQNIDALPASGPMFAPLQDPQVRAQFRDFVINQLNPEASRVVGDAGKEFLQRAAYAFLGPTMAQSAQQQAEAARHVRTVQRQNAAGDAGGARPGPVQADPWAAELASMGVIDGHLLG